MKGKMMKTYIIANIRKSDGKVFLPQSFAHENTTIFGVALEEAKRKARECSNDYYYSVLAVEEIAMTQRAEPPVEVIFISERFKNG